MMVVDSALGMMYGTILSPVLVAVGFSPVLVVPSILLSQTVGDLSAAPFHHRFRNADFRGLTKDVKVVLAMVVPGLAAVVVGVVLALKLPMVIVCAYIGVLVVVMSLICLLRRRFKYQYKFHLGYGVVASFNKAISGGGFGPITSTGGIMGGLKPRASVATTSFAELIICVASLVCYLALGTCIDPCFAGPMCAGAFIGGIVGPYAASRVNQDRLRVLIAVLGIAVGVWLLIKVF